MYGQSLAGINSPIQTVSPTSDTVSPGNILTILSTMFGFDGVFWNRFRNNLQATLLTSAARTGTTNTADQTNFNAKGVVLFMDVTAQNGTSTLQLQAKDPASAKYFPLITWTLTAAIQSQVLSCYPGATDQAATPLTQTQSLPLPRVWRAQWNLGTATSVTFSLGMSYVL